MHKVAVRLITGIVVASVICGGIYGGLTVYRNSQVKPVTVFQVADVVMPAEYFMEDSQSYGSVAADRIQSVFISGTQNVKEVLVKPGQEVKKGDPLITYDTTLTSIQLEKAENELAQQELALKRAEEELEKIKRLVPHDEDDDAGLDGDLGPDEPDVTPTPTPEPKKYDPQETAVRVKGEGTISNPYIYLWSSLDALTEEQLLAMFTSTGEFVRQDDPQAVTASFADEGVEVADELRIWRGFGLLPLNVYGDDAVEVGEEEIASEGIDPSPDALSSEEAPYSEFEAGSTDTPPENYEVEVMPDDVTDQYPTEHIEYTVEDGEEEDFEEDGIEEGIEEEENSFVDGGQLIVVTPESEQTSSAENANSGSQGTDYSFLNGAPNEVYVVLEKHQNDNMSAPLEYSVGLHLIRDGHKVAVRLYDPAKNAPLPKDVEKIDDEDDIDGEEEDDLDDIPYGGGGYYDDEDYEDDDEDDVAPSLNDSSIDFEASYTAKEIEEMRIQKEKEIRDETISYKLSVVNMREMKREMSDGAVRSKVNGTVKTVRDPDDAYKNSEAVVVVSGGGGYTVGISVSELELDSLAVDQQVTITSFDNDTEYMGYVSSISDYPASSMDGWSMGNPNVSYYPCVVNIADDAEFREGDYVSVKYSGDEADSGSSFYVEKMYVRSDSSGRYVYMKNKDNLLEKRYIVTGKSPDSYIIEVRGGITQNDYIAFPYGTDVTDGTPTQTGSVDDLYG